MKTALLITATTLAFSTLGFPGLAAGEDGREPDGRRQAELQQVLMQNCAVCHGLKLKGKTGPALTAKALASKNEQVLVNTILEGRPGTSMPAWGFMLKENEARWLVQQLRNRK